MVDKALTIQDDHKLVDNPAGYGDRNDIFTLAERIGKVMSITCADGRTRRPPTPKESALIANYSMSVGANCFRNEVHVWEDENGQLVMCDDYKLLVRWANTQMPFTDDYRVLSDEEKDYENINRGDLAVECFVLRRDHQDLFREMMLAFIRDGLRATEAKWEAYKIAASRSIGVVSYNEMYGKDNRGGAYLKTKKIPKGWGTFVKRARTRALRAAVRISHRTPSPQEIYQTGLQIGRTQTQADDWQGVEVYKTEGERIEAAKIEAWNREREQADAEKTPEERRGQFEANVNAMRGPEDEPGIGDEPEEGDYTDLPAGDPDFTPIDESGEWNEGLAALGDEPEADTIIYDGPQTPREFFAIVNEERQRLKMKPFGELKDLSSFLKSRDLTDGGAWPKEQRTWGMAYQATITDD